MARRFRLPTIKSVTMFVNRNKLKLLRESKNISQLEMADKLFISQSAYSKLELGKTSLYLETALKISGYLNCNVEDVVDIPIQYHLRKKSLSNDESDNSTGTFTECQTHLKEIINLLN